MTDACNAIISVLNDNDVLLGRGRGSTNHIGNERFRALTRLRKEEYKLCDNNGQKTTIAYEIFHEVVDNRGGRFLQLVDDGNPPRDILETGRWRSVSFKASIEKCKQALREKDDPDDETSDDGSEHKKRRNTNNQGPRKRQKITSTTETQPPGDQISLQAQYLSALKVPGTTPRPLLVANSAGTATSSSDMNQALVRIQQKILLAQHQALMQRRVAMNGLVKSMHSRSGSSQSVFRNSIPIVGRLVRPPLSALAPRPMMATPTLNVMPPFVSKVSLEEIEKVNALGRLTRPMVAVAPSVHAAAPSTSTINDKPVPIPRDNPCITEAEKDAVSGLFTLAVTGGNAPNSDSR
mmetsp:Transcript_18655/g.33762  ORF Transcript_18655/g.33762 Transcript_18655/m.33762 type:complete len:350 (-) Transcript_18655:107-1156(-)|eukprot:CAMPEP_0202502610 /NCGR_PEP_ID=MMETSP1361-20130828/39469_1 /ASSEMBLY_ACC=CAM_ASM_000849 /TAXON_ID=210615 /ORGANISM="Staurosira complex sp., Strain CCMP2646" /LENGTH=349 /DNA_ID=CAMNT_0049135659 /DNA_START=61 /DNA_END=1110 /DNA_ORIENTATION=-